MIQRNLKYQKLHKNQKLHTVSEKNILFIIILANIIFGWKYEHNNKITFVLFSASPPETPQKHRLRRRIGNLQTRLHREKKKKISKTLKLRNALAILREYL